MAPRVILIIAATMFCGCSTHPERRAASEPGLKAPTAALVSGEQIRVEVRLDRPSSAPFWTSVTIDQKGDIAVIGGTVHIAGLTPTEAAKTIRDYYAHKEAMWGHAPPRVSVSRF